MGKGALGLLAAYWPEDTPRYAHVPLKTATEIALHGTASAAADRTALVTAAGPRSYREVSEAVRRLAGVLRGRHDKGARVAIVVNDSFELVTAALGSIEAGMLTWIAGAAAPPGPLAKFSPELVVGAGGVAYAELSAALAEEKPAGRPDYRSPVLVLPKPDGSGEVLHNHRTLAATAIAVGAFYMIEAETRVVLYEPPASWLTLALLLGAWQRGGTVIAAWGEKPAPLPERVDYVVCSWDEAGRRFLAPPAGAPRLRVAAGAIVGIETGFSLSRRRRMSRRLGSPVLTLFGRSDVGPAIGSHPTWFLDDAAGIPLPNVDTRPLNPRDGNPLNIGWDAVEEAELGIKSALAPAGGTVMAEGWIRTETAAAIDPTGLYFLRPPGQVAAAR